MKKIITIIIAVHCSLFTAQLSEAQDTVYVPQDYPTIQQGIDAAVDGNLVLVDTGTYFENIYFKSKAITVKSYYDPENSDSFYIDNTIIDGSKPANPTLASVVKMEAGADTNFVIQGFTIKKGTGSQYGNIRIGGGIYCLGGGKIINNTFVDNTVENDEWAGGAGIYAEGYASSYFIIRDNIIENNNVHTNSANMAYGCGIFAYGSHLIIENNVIKSNLADGRPYGVGLFLEQCYGSVKNNTIIKNEGNNTAGGRSRGAGIYIVNPLPDLNICNNTITDNHLNQNTYTAGGGIQVLNTGGFEDNAILIDGNIISNNSSKYGAGISFTEIYNITISNNLIKSNGADFYGGGVFFQDYNKEDGNECIGVGTSINSNDKMKSSGSFIPVLVNNTIISNSVNSYGGGIYSGMNDNEFIAFNNIIYDNIAGNEGDEIYLVGNCNAKLYYNDIDENKIGGSGTWTGAGNIFCDPEFKDDDGHLLWNSPCIGAGQDSIEISDSVYHCPDHDMDGDARPECVLVDIGADETPFWVKVKEPNLVTAQVSVYPNPIQGIANIQYTIYNKQSVNLSVYDSFGRKIETLVDEMQQAREYSVAWNAEDLPAGVYLYRLTAGEKVASGKLIKR